MCRPYVFPKYYVFRLTLYCHYSRPLGASWLAIQMCVGETSHCASHPSLIVKIAIVLGCPPTHYESFSLIFCPQNLSLFICFTYFHTTHANPCAQCAHANTMCATIKFAQAYPYYVPISAQERHLRYFCQTKNFSPAYTHRVKLLCDS